MSSSLLRATTVALWVIFIWVIDSLILIRNCPPIPFIARGQDSFVLCLLMGNMLCRFHLVLKHSLLTLTVLCLINVKKALQNTMGHSGALIKWNCFGVLRGCFLSFATVVSTSCLALKWHFKAGRGFKEILSFSVFDFYCKTWNLFVSSSFGCASGSYHWLAHDIFRVVFLIMSGLATYQAE